MNVNLFLKDMLDKILVKTEKIEKELKKKAFQMKKKVR